MTDMIFAPSHNDATIFALSSGMPPAAIAVLRISGPQAGAALAALAGRLPEPRRATLATLRDPTAALACERERPEGDTAALACAVACDGGSARKAEREKPEGALDRALILWFPGPATATGEDLAEIHAHGGRAIVRAIEAALAAQPGLRRAQPGEFTRRALDNGRIDLAEAEGLADLLEAETEGQRRHALAMAGGALSRAVGDWQQRLLLASARIEALLDFADEDDVIADDLEIQNIINEIAGISGEWRSWLARPHAERLRDGLSVAIAGPPNAGKSTLLNALAEREAAITSPVAGTTRDIIEVPLALSGIAFRFADTAGLHAGTGDAIESEGMARAADWIAHADILLWLGSPDTAPTHPVMCRIAAQADRFSVDPAWSLTVTACDIRLSALSGEGMADLRNWLVATAERLLPGEGEVAINQRHRDALAVALVALDEGCTGLSTGKARDGCVDLSTGKARENDPLMTDPLILAEGLRAARIAIDRITGRAGTEAMLDALFGRFCVGK